MFNASVREASVQSNLDMRVPKHTRKLKYQQIFEQDNALRYETPWRYEHTSRFSMAFKWPSMRKATFENSLAQSFSSNQVDKVLIRLGKS